MNANELNSGRTLVHGAFASGQKALQQRISHYRAMFIFLLAISLLSTSSNNLVAASSLRRLGKSGKGIFNEKKGSKKLSVVAAASGAQEVPPVDTDTKAQVLLTFDEGFTKASFRLDIDEGSGITQAHLHCAPAGLNGPPVAFLFSDGRTGGVDIDGTANSGELTNVDLLTPLTCADIEISTIASLYEAILNRLIYVNVHSADYPSGEVRGQIFP